MFKMEVTFLANHCYCQKNIEGLKFHGIGCRKSAMYSFVLSSITLENDERSEAQTVAYFDCHRPK